MTIRSLSKLKTSCLILLFSTVNLSAQQNTGKVYGIVTGEQGAVISQADVNLAQKSSGGDWVIFQTVKSNNDGEFNLENIPTGIYKITVEFYDEMSYENENVTVAPDQITKLNAQICYGGCTEKDSTAKPIEITDADKAEIVNQILKNALTEKTLPDYDSLEKQKEAIVLSTKNIKPAWLKLPATTKLRLKTQKEIQHKADTTKDFLYLSFAEFRQAKKGIVVTLSNSWAVGKNSRMVYLSGGGNVYLYRKESNKWLGKCLGGWIS